jgi:hypothetical protein
VQWNYQSWVPHHEIIERLKATYSAIPTINYVAQCAKSWQIFNYLERWHFVSFFFFPQISPARVCWMTDFFSISVLHEFGGLGLGVHYDHILQIIDHSSFHLVRHCCCSELKNENRNEFWLESYLQYSQAKLGIFIPKTNTRTVNVIKAKPNKEPDPYQTFAYTVAW